MQNEKFVQDVLDFNKNAVKMSFDALATYSDQATKVANQLLENAPLVPEEAQKALDSFVKQNQKAQSNLKTCVETGLEIDWTSTEAPQKGLEAVESYYNSACTQVSAIQKETADLLKKSSDKLPKEAQPVVDFWNQAFTSNFEMVQGFVSQNFEFAKKVMATGAAAAPKATAKAATK